MTTITIDSRVRYRFSSGVCTLEYKGVVREMDGHRALVEFTKPCCGKYWIDESRLSPIKSAVVQLLAARAAREATIGMLRQHELAAYRHS